MPVSIKDIARVADVSFSTVSRALNDSPRVNIETKTRIQRIAAEMGYAPSAVARSLVMRRTQMIGIVVTTITDLFFAEVIRAIEETALGYGHGVVLTNSRGQPERELEAIQSLRERRVDGIILVSGYCSKEDLCAELGIDIPLVIINRVRQERIGHSIEVDNVGGGRIATQHLLELGHRRIAYIAGPTREWDGNERQMGYEQALGTHGIPVDHAVVVRGGNEPAHGIVAVEQLLALPAPPTALFCYSDAVALGAMRAVRAAGMSVPQDMSVVGFDDISLAPFFEPPLTTVAQSIQEMGSKAVEMVLDLMEGKKVSESMLPSRLVIRESTSHPKRSA